MGPILRLTVPAGIVLPNAEMGEMGKERACSELRVEVRAWFHTHWV